MDHVRLERSEPECSTYQKAACGQRLHARRNYAVHDDAIDSFPVWQPVMMARDYMYLVTISEHARG
jgi:hypothetical protein